MANQPSVTGRTDEGLPFLRFGTGGGDAALVVIPGIADALYDDGYLAEFGWPMRAFLERSYAAVAAKMPVWIVGRPRGMTAGTTTQDIADQYINFIDRETGPVHLRGESMGGMISQWIAARRSDLVRSLILVASGYRVAEDAAATMEYWAQLARNEDWRSVYAGMAEYLYTGWRKEMTRGLESLGKAFGLQHEPEDPSDFLISLQACVSHDSRETLAQISTPTIVISGAEDKLFPIDMAKSTTELIPNAELALIEGAAHGVYFEKKKEFDAVFVEFLSRFS